MKILVLGNGFDLAHKLSTRYTDFLDYVILYKEKNEDKNNEENNFDKCIYNNVWINYLINIYNQKLIRGINWIDFELEISHILKTFDKLDNNIYNLIVPLQKINNDKKVVLFYKLFAYRIGGAGIGSVTEKTYLDLINVMEEDMERMIRAFEIYLINYVDKTDIKLVSPDIERINADRILSFNYTHTYERLYSKSSNIIQHIHGEVSEEKKLFNNMVLGVGEYWNINIASEHVNYNIFKKFTQRVIKETGYEYRKWIETECKSQYSKFGNIGNLGITNVYIFGHSLDVTDSDIIREFFAEECFRIHIYYHDKKKQASLIANIIKMIGESDFINQINAYPPKIEFLQQEDMRCVAV